MVKVILASKSARRQEILRTLGVDYSLLACDVDETVGKMSPEETVKTLAGRKCSAASSLLTEEAESYVVISADTVVSFGDEIFGKPKDREDAVRMLSALSGGMHQVHTGIAVSDGYKMTVESETTKVFFRELSTDEISRYVDSGEPMDKAGAYGIQELGGLFVSAVSGDYFNIVGLPICRLGKILSRDFGIDLLAISAKNKRLK